MDDLIPLPRPVRSVRAGVPTPGMIGRLILAFGALLAVSLLTLPSMARAQGAVEPAAPMRLRGDVTAKGDVLTLGDLVENAPAPAATKPLFRAPALGATGTIQAARILEAAARHGLGVVETGGRAQVGVLRAARRVGPSEIEAALKRALQATYGLDPRTIGLRLDGEATSLLAPVALDGPVEALDVAYDARSRRFGGLAVLGERQASLRVAGLVIEMREVAVLTRPLGRGEAITVADLALERRPRDATPPDAAAAAPDRLAGLVAQRTLAAGTVLRAGDAAPPDLVQRGEAVTIVFETPGVALSLVGLANESGRLGATVAVLNAASKKVLQATVIGPGRVAVGPARGMPIWQASAALDPKPGL